MNFKRPYIDTKNLKDGRLKSSEYEKAVKYVTELFVEQKGNLESSLDTIDLDDLLEKSGADLLSDQQVLQVFNAGKEMYSFLGTLPERDIVPIFKYIFLGIDK